MTDGTFDDRFVDDLDRLFRWRRDVRRFSREPLEPHLLPEILAAAELSPSVGNSQPWRWVEVQTRSAREAVRDSFVRCNSEALDGHTGERAQLYSSLKLAGLDDAPVHLAVFCEPDPDQGHGLGRQTVPETLEYSVVTAITTMWLAARARGVGIGWVSILDPNEVTAALAVPPTWKLVAYLCIGYPDQKNDVPELERVGWQSRTESEKRHLIR
ncbi:5,6-dimethylbenzimidazole synthase [Gordonia rubripertincta]|uniref:5,6-dimethylbenzimidazole synthase n=2 Tax=Gordonia rubripertincta TaxID=36822 RepID=A0AAW6R3W5_GORRU|nr:5,6-dimethylbenzimidazole synthase [Gordonia rubripertincta]MDG6779834.1 5,6-dimethylbenzimidazole synthase [Gordonia rubripertincta]NKY63821.1 5,6-dimethylbenzimidazole synthase [Gordonia rubripertincta]GAB86108.1 putative oxidoreductase [Gordonia rubripertincta NBRC 101908]